MDILDRAMGNFGISKGIDGVIDSSFFLRGMTLSEALQRARDSHLPNAYSGDVWVYSAIYACALNLSRVPFRFFNGTDMDKEQVENSQFEELFDRPNPFMSRFQLWEATLIYLKMRGECMWVLEYGEKNPLNNIPIEIYPMDPLLFKPVIDKEAGVIAMWEMRGRDGQTSFLEPKLEVIQFKKFNPFDQLRGLSPLDPASLSIKTGMRSRIYNDSLMQNQGTPGGALHTEQPLDERAMDQIVSRWEQRHSGTNNARRIAVLHSGLKYQDTAFTPREMEFIKTRNVSMEEILAVLRVPKTTVNKFDDVRKETAEVQARSLWTDNLIPEAMYIEDQLWADFFGPKTRNTEWGLFDLSSIEALQDNLHVKATTAKSFFDMGLPLNEINRRLNLGFEDVPWGDIGYLPINLLPADQTGLDGFGEPQEESFRKRRSIQIKRGRPGHRWIEIEEIKETKVIKRPELEIPGLKLTLLKIPQPGDYNPITDKRSRAREALYQQFFRRILPLEISFRKRLRGFIFELRQEVLEKFFRAFRAWEGTETKQDPSEFQISVVFDKAEERLFALAQAFINDASKIGGERIAAFGFEFSIMDPKITSIIQERTGKITRITRTIEDQLRLQLADGLKLGETSASLAQRIRNVFGLANARAKTIARTEIANAANEAFVKAEETNGFKKHEWLTAGDEVVRDSHARVDNQAVRIGEPFGNGLRFPGDPLGPAGEVINCRCTVVPVIE